jgi:DNA-directed RNA polymerase specialized sigma24 family protein
MSRDDIAKTLSLTVPTVKRDLSVAEAFLRRELAL